MPSGSYRRSFEEQQTRQRRARREARLKRIVAVRHQTEVFRTDGLRQYHKRLAENEAAAKARLKQSWELRRDVAVAALQRRLAREECQLGRAHREAMEWATDQARCRPSTDAKRQSREEAARRRFCVALRRLREKEEHVRRPTRMLVRSRIEEQQRGRQLANAHASSHSGKTLKNGRWRPLPKSKAKAMRPSIDFRFSRMHQRLGVEDVKTCDHGQAVDAKEAATIEDKRLSATMEEKKRERSVAREKARDRGHVALLRERAIIRSQLEASRILKREALLEKAKQNEAYRNTPRQRPRAFRRDSKPPTQAIEGDSTLDRTSFQKAAEIGRRYAKAQHVRPENAKDVSSADVAAQVEEQDFSPSPPQMKESTQRIGDKEIPPRQSKSALHGVSRSTQTKPSPREKAAKEKRDAFRAASKEASVPRIKIPNDASQSGRTSDARAKKTLPGRQTTMNGTDTRNRSHPSIHKERDGLDVPCRSSPDEETGLFVTQQSASQTYEKTAVRGHPKHDRSDEGHRYEDALSEALSMETDRFMDAYLISNKDLKAPESHDLSSDCDAVEMLSAMLDIGQATPRRPDCIHRKCESAIYETSNEILPSISVTPSETAFASPRPSSMAHDWSSVSETEFSCLDTSRCNSVSSTEFETLLEDLNAISGDSLQLLSCLSDMLTTQSSEVSKPISSIPSPNSLSTSVDDQEIGSLATTENSNNHDSSFCHLDTILEESGDDSLPSISLTATTETLS